MTISDYPSATSFLGQTVTIVIDRPSGSRHPAHGFTYPINYGYVPGAPAPDGEELDAYLWYYRAFAAVYGRMHRRYSSPEL